MGKENYFLIMILIISIAITVIIVSTVRKFGGG